MPQISGVTTEDSGSKLTSYTGNISSTSQNFTFTESQDGMTFINKGASMVTLTVNSQVYKVPPLATIEVDDDNFSSFDAVTVSGTQSFEVRAFVKKSSVGNLDSIREQLAENTQLLKPYGNRAIALGDSITAGNVDLVNGAFGDTSWFSHVVVRSKGRIQYLYNAGIPGNTTSQMLGRIQSDVLDKNPDICFVLGGTNDVGQGIDYLITQSNLEEIINILLSKKIVPILATIPPRNDTTKHIGIAKVNTIVRNLASKYRLHLLDFYSVLVNASNGYFKTGLDADGVHPNANGSKVMSLVAEKNLLPLLPTWQTLLHSSNSDPLNLIKNGMNLTDTDGNGIPDSWIAYGGGISTHSVINSDVEIGGNWAEINKTGSADMRVLEQTINTGFVVGDKIAVTGRIYAEAETGNLQYSVQVKFNGINKTVKPISNWSKDVNGVFYNEFLVPSGTTSINLSLIASTGIGKVRLAQAGIVNLTSLGI